MQKTGFFLVALLLLSSFWAGCDKTQTYAEKLKAEKKAIERFIDKNNIEVLKKMPADSIFKPNQFFRTPEGLYLNVIEWHFSPNIKFNDSIKPGDEVAVRGKYIHYFMTNDPWVYNWNDDEPIKFKYNPSKTEGGYTPLAWDIALQYVNNYALVKMIVPSVIGFKEQLNSVVPVFYDSLWFNRLVLQ